ncbi:hypothetical protein BJX61DRAFT_492605 [Aspergillus egyptiacus]|nr:hypothetical protein BJX61DRAFT_492605 [Aspergillus egyptiacus]
MRPTWAVPALLQLLPTTLALPNIGTVISLREENDPAQLNQASLRPRQCTPECLLEKPHCGPWEPVKRNGCWACCEPETAMDPEFEPEDIIHLGHDHDISPTGDRHHILVRRDDEGAGAGACLRLCSRVENTCPENMDARKMGECWTCCLRDQSRVQV